jgi:antitoxin VapB
MNLQIRDPRAHELASELARKRNVSMTDAVIAALEAELQRSAKTRLALIAEDLATQAKPGGHDPSRDEIDALWGHS